jgi:hypothetical protein
MNDQRLSLVGVGVGNSLIEHLAKYRSAELPHAVLTSVMSYDVSLAIELLVRAKSPVEVFARAFCFSMLEEQPEQCAKLLRSLGPELVEFLLKYEAVWAEERYTLTKFGQVLLETCEFALLEAVLARLEQGEEADFKEEKVLQVANLLGGQSSPLYLLFLEILYDRFVVPKRDPDSGAGGAGEGSSLSSFSEELHPSTGKSIPPPADDETITRLLVQGYGSRCESEETMCFPLRWSSKVEQFGSMRVSDVFQVPREIKWKLKHWRGLPKIPRLVWIATVPPFTVSDDEDNLNLRKYFYVCKLQNLLLHLQSQAPHLWQSCADFLVKSPTINKTVWEEWCSMFWLPATGQLREALRQVKETFASDPAFGFCVQFCTTATDWKMVLEMFAEAQTGGDQQSQLYSLLLARCSELFSPEEMIAEVLPGEGSVQTFLPYLWKSFEGHSTRMLNSISTYTTEN